MANLFLPKIASWFRLDEHVRRLIGRVDVLENNPSIQSITGDIVDDSDPLNLIIETPNLQQVTAKGNTTNLNIISSNSARVRSIEVRQTTAGTAAGLYGTGKLLLKNTSGFTGDLSVSNLTNNRSFQFPNTSGTLLTDAPADSQNYVRNNNSWVVSAGGSSELQKLNEGNGDGYRLLGRNPALFGNIGLDAIDFSYSDDLSSTRGATGSRTFITGRNNIVAGPDSAVIGGSGNNLDSNSSSSTILGGSNNSVTISSYSTILGGFGNTVTGDRAVSTGFANTSKSFTEFVVGSCSTNYTPVGVTTFWETDRAFNVGVGPDTANRRDGFTVFKNARSKFGGVAQLKGYTVSTLPPGELGDTAYVKDATAPTYLGSLVGGGSVTCPVFYNGTAWVSH